MADEKTISIDVVRQMMAEQARQNAEMLKEVIQELKKPTILEQKELDKEVEKIRAANEERKANAAGILMKMQQDRFEKETCSHEHRNGVSHGVFIQEKAPSPGYILCQACQGNIRPGSKPAENADPRGVYSTALFNEMFQKLPSSELFM